MLKRVVSLITAVSITLMSLCSVHAASENSSELYQNEVKILEELGISSELSNISAKLSRTDFLKIVTGIINIVPHEDVITAAVENGLIIGYPDGTLGEYNNITLYEAAKILLNAMGYSIALNGNDTLEESAVYASSIGLFDGLSDRKNIELTRGAAAKLIFNALDSKIIQQEYSNGHVVLTRSDKTMLEQFKKIYKSKGIITANEYTGLYDVQGLAKDTVEINNTVYTCLNEGVKQYLGYYVEYYYTEIDDEETILSAMPLKNRNETVILDGNDIYDVVKSANDQYRISYYAGNRMRYEYVYSTKPVIYNGKLRTIYDKDTFKPEIGEVILLDNDSDGKNDIAIVNDYKTIVVSSTDKTDKVIFDNFKSGSGYDVQEEDGKSVIFFDKNGSEIGFETISEWSVISMLISLDGKYVRGYVSNDVSEGQVTGINNDSKDTFIEVSGESYRLSKYFTDTQSAYLKMDGTFYLDFFGNVAAFKKNTNVSGYCYLMKVKVLEDTDRLLIKYMDSTGRISKTMTAEKVRIDGVLFKHFTAVPADIASPCVAVCQFNEENEIKYIDTVRKTASAENDDTLRSFGDMESLSYYKTPQCFKDKLYAKSDAIVFCIPDTASGDYQDIDYSVKTIAELTSSTKYNVQGFSTNSNSMFPELFLIKDTPDISKDKEFVIVSKIYQGLNEDDEIVDIISGYRRDVEVELECRNGSVLSGKAISCGDIIKYSLDANGKVNIVDVLYSVSSNSVVTSESYSTSTDFGNRIFLSKGKLYDRENNVLFLSNATDLSTTSMGNLTCVVANVGAIYLVDSSEILPKEKIKRIKLDEIRTYKKNSVSQDVLAVMSNTANTFVVIYK